MHGVDVKSLTGILNRQQPGVLILFLDGHRRRGHSRMLEDIGEKLPDGLKQHVGLLLIEQRRLGREHTDVHLESLLRHLFGEPMEGGNEPEVLQHRGT